MMPSLLDHNTASQSTKSLYTDLLIFTTALQWRRLCTDGRCPPLYFYHRLVYGWEEPHNCKGGPLPGVPMLRLRAHDLARKVLSTLAHGPHGFVLQKAPHMERMVPFYINWSSLTHNQRRTNDALPSTPQHYLLNKIHEWECYDIERTEYRVWQEST